MKQPNILQHLINNKEKYLSGLLFVILLTPLITNFILQKPLIMGNESYYLLQRFGMEMSESLFIAFIFLIGFSWLFLSLQLAKSIKLNNTFTFFFLLLVMISPAFIYAVSTFSAGLIFLTLVLIGFLLLRQKYTLYRSLSIFPFLLATTFDLFSTIILLLLLWIYFFIVHRERRLLSLIPIAITIVSFMYHLIISQSFIIGPLHSEFPIADLISDLGGLSGVSFFIIILALIGIAFTWEKKNLYFAYFFLPILIPGYIISSQIVFLFSLCIIFFATIGLIKLIEMPWTLKDLKQITFLLLTLGIIFSTLTFLDRIADTSPTKADSEAFIWIRDNTPQEATVFTSIDNQYLVEFIAQRKAIVEDPKNPAIFNSTYIQELFPLLENKSINLIYLNGKLKHNLPEEQGLRFLFKNERFKLVHSYEDSEVWLFS